MALQILFVSGFLSFGSGLLILFLIYRRCIEGYLDARLWRNYFMPTHHFFLKGRHRRHKHGFILSGVAVVLIILGISAMLHVDGLYDAEAELHKHESETGHQLESREIRRESTTPESSF